MKTDTNFAAQKCWCFSQYVWFFLLQL